MPVPGGPSIIPLRREDRDAVGWSSKRVAESGPPVVRAFAQTKEGREERAQQAEQRKKDNQNRPLPSHSRGRGHRPFRGGGGGGRGGRPGWNSFGPGGGNAADHYSADAPMRNGTGGWDQYRPPPSGPRRDLDGWASHSRSGENDRVAIAPRQGEAGPSTWNSNRAYSPSQPTETSHHQYPKPVQRYTPPQSNPIPRALMPPPIWPDYPPTAAVPSSAIVPSVPVEPSIPKAPPTKMVFRPTRRVASSSTAPDPKIKKVDVRIEERARREEVDELKEEDNREERVQTGGKGEDRKPTAQELEYTPVDPDSQVTGTLALRKKDIPVSCFTQPGKDRVLARQQFKTLHYEQLLKQGKVATHSMWRDDGFAVDWERAEKASSAVSDAGGKPVSRGISTAPPEPAIPLSTPANPKIPTPAASPGPSSRQRSTSAIIAWAISPASSSLKQNAPPSNDRQSTPRPLPFTVNPFVPVENSNYLSWSESTLEPYETTYERSDAAAGDNPQDLPRPSCWVNKYRMPTVVENAIDPVTGRKQPSNGRWRRQLWWKAAELDAEGKPTVRVDRLDSRKEGGVLTIKLTRLEQGEEWELPKWASLPVSRKDGARSGPSGEPGEGAGEQEREMLFSNSGSAESTARGVKSAKRPAEDPPKSMPKSKKTKGGKKEEAAKGPGSSQESKKTREKKAKQQREESRKSQPGSIAPEQNGGRAAGRSDGSAIPNPQHLDPSSRLAIPVGSNSSSKIPSPVLPFTPRSVMAGQSESDPSSSSARTLDPSLPSSSTSYSAPATHQGPSARATTPSHPAHATIPPASETSTSLRDPPSTQPSSSVNTPTLLQLENDLFANLEKIDLWTQMVTDYPSRKEALRKQVDRVQEDIFRLQAEIGRRKRGS